jgi:shikimate dehydrogenase
MDKSPLAGVIGCPISHSKSPLIHGYWLKTLRISGHYLPFHVEPENLGSILTALPKLGFVGINVTLPHKEAVLTFADTVTDRAAQIGAANTLTFLEDGKIHADNTDGYGFLENLRTQAPDWDPLAKPAAILGAGGAARAVVSSLLDAGVPELRISNRTRSRAQELRNLFGERLAVFDWDASDKMIEDAGLLVNSTSLGMTGKAPLELSLDRLSPNTLVTDLVYSPLETELLRKAKSAGCQTVDGLGMLIHQAVPGFERWFGQKPIIDDTIRQIALS